MTPIQQADPAVREFDESLRKARDLRARDDLKGAENELERLFRAQDHGRDPYRYNLALNELEITQKKTVLRSKPRQMGLTLTHRCNILCTMCFYPTDPWDMPEERIEEIYGLIPYLERVFWQGGEAFVSRHFRGLYRAAATHPQLHNVLVTNGLLINDEWAETLVSSNASIVFSIDGVTAPTYEKIRAGGKFTDLERALRAVARERKRRPAGGFSRRFETVFQMTVQKDNVHELDRVVEFVRRHEFDALNLLPIQNVRGPENIFYHRDREAFDHLERNLPRIQEECQRYGIRLHVQLPRFADPEAPPQGPEKTPDGMSRAMTGISLEGDLHCYWPWLSMFVLLRGATKPYGWCCENSGDITRESFAQLWNNEGMQKYRGKIARNENVGFCDNRCTSGTMPRVQLGRDLN